MQDLSTRLYSLKVNILKNVLRLLSLRTTGNKPELVQRIVSVASYDHANVLQAIQSATVPPAESPNKALASTVSANQIRNPFWQLISVLSSQETLFFGKSLTFIATLDSEKQRQVLEPSTEDRSYHVYLLCVDAKNQSSLQYPHFCEIKVNQEILPEQTMNRLKGMKKKPTAVSPLDVTPWLRINQPNRVDIRMTNSNPNSYGQMPNAYICKVAYVCVYSAERVTRDLLKNTPLLDATITQNITKSPQLMAPVEPASVPISSVKSCNVISAENSMDKIKEKFKYDDDLQCSVFTLKLVDPLSQMRIECPARLVSCEHFDCFDLLSWLQMNKMTPTWECPVCLKSTLDPLTDIRIDGFLLEVLEKTCDKVRSIGIDVSDGFKWSGVEESDNEEESDDEQPPWKKQKFEIVDLCNDEDIEPSATASACPPFILLD